MKPDTEALLEKWRAGSIISRSEALRLAAEAPTAALQEGLAAPERRAVCATLCLLALGRHDSASAAVADLAARSTAPTVASLARHCLLLLGPGGRSRLPGLARDSRDPEALDALKMGVRIPAFRPAAADCLAEIGAAPDRDPRARLLAAAAALQAGWAAGASAILAAFTESGWEEDARRWIQDGWPRYRKPPGFDPLTGFLPDFVAGVLEEVTARAERIEAESEAYGRRLEEGCAARRSELRALRERTRPGRNDPCFCGSSRKFKKCCEADYERADREYRALESGDYPVAGFRQTPFERPADEAAGIAMLAMEDRPSILDPGRFPSDYLRWFAVHRLQAGGHRRQCIQAGLDLLERWDADAGLDYPEVLEFLGVGVLVLNPASAPRFLRIFAQRAAPTQLFDFAREFALRSNLDGLECLIEETLARRAEDCDVVIHLAAACFSSPGLRDEARGAALAELVRDALAAFPDDARARDAAAALHVPDPDDGGPPPVPAEGRFGVVWQALPAFRGRARVIQLERSRENVREGMTPPDALDPCSRAPWDRERAIRAARLAEIEREVDAEWAAALDALRRLLWDRPHLLALAHQDGELCWILPAGDDPEGCCGIAAAAGRLASCLGFPLAEDRYLRLERRGRRTVLRQLVPETELDVLALAGVVLQEVLEAEAPAIVPMPIEVLDGLPLAPLPPLLPGDHPFACKAARAGVHELELAAHLGALEYHGIEGAAPRPRARVEPAPEAQIQVPEPSPLEAEAVDEPTEAPSVEDPIPAEIREVRAGRTVAEALERAEDESRDILVVWESARDSALASRFARPREVYDALRALADLGRACARAHDDGIPMGTWYGFLRARGLRYKSHESESSMNLYGGERIFHNDGVRMQMKKHVTLGGGDRNNCLQIYFEMIDGHVVVGYCGPHLRIIRSRT